MLGDDKHRRGMVLPRGRDLRRAHISTGARSVGEVLRSSGPDGCSPPAIPLAERLRALGLSMRRFKTGTPPRVNARSVDFSKMELQPGDAEPESFSFSTETAPENRAVCYLTYTNEHTHRDHP